MAVLNSAQNNQNIYQMPDLTSRVREVFSSAASVILQESDLSPHNPRVTKAVGMIVSLCRQYPDLKPDILDFNVLPGPDPRSDLVERFMQAEQELEKHFARLIIARGIQRNGLEWPDMRIYPWFKDYPAIFEFEYKVLGQALAEMAPLSAIGYIGPGALPLIPMMLAEKTGKNILSVDTDVDSCDLGNRICEDMGYSDQIRIFWGDGMSADMLMGSGLVILSNSPQHNDAGLLGILTALNPRYVYARIPAGLAGAIFPSVQPLLITALGYEMIEHARSNGSSTNDGMLFRRIR